MVARLHNATFSGIEAVHVEVELDVARCGFAGATVVGLAFCQQSLPTRMLEDMMDKINVIRRVASVYRNDDWRGGCIASVRKRSMPKGSQTS
jgi:hypothetical protein